LESATSGFLQRPQIGASPARSFSEGMRLVAPQLLQRINCGSVIVLSQPTQGTNLVQGQIIPGAGAEGSTSRIQ
jgi:hypothetical protein